MSINLSKSITSENRLAEMLEETELELGKIQPQIEKLEKQMEKLKELRQAKQKLITLKLSLKSILENFSELENENKDVSRGDLLLSQSQGVYSFSGQQYYNTTASHYGQQIDPNRIFLPDKAFHEVSHLLRKRQSLNYEIFRAVVFNGGRATTEQVRDYLIEHNIKQPTSGESFAEASLSEISSRVNYLVRKGIVEADGRGLFVSKLGWTDQNEGENA